MGSPFPHAPPPPPGSPMGSPALQVGELGLLQYAPCLTQPAPACLLPRDQVGELGLLQHVLHTVPGIEDAGAALASMM